MGVLRVVSDVLLVKRYFTCQLTSHPHSDSPPGHKTPAQPHSEQHATIATTLGAGSRGGGYLGTKMVNNWQMAMWSRSGEYRNLGQVNSFYSNHYKRGS